MVNGQNFFDQPVKNNIITYNNILKITTVQGDDSTTCYPSFNEYYNMITTYLSKQQALDADSKENQKTKFTGNLQPAGITTMFFIFEEAEETILEFLEGTVKVL